MKPLRKLMASALLIAFAQAVVVTPARADTPIPAPKSPGRGITLEVFNPGDKAIFAVSSVLVEGRKDAILIDAQFSAADARTLVERIKASGKRLKTIYISHGDPDYYFGLDTLHRAFPDAKILATAPTIAHIRTTSSQKLKVWGPKLGDNAPKAIIVPDAVAGDSLLLEGNVLRIVGLDGPTPDRSVVWIPELRAVVGGIPVVGGEHVWMADTQTPQSHRDWLSMLDRIRALKPQEVVPGHYAPGIALDMATVTFTAGYIRDFDDEVGKSKDSAELIEAMKKRYPHLGGVDSLVLSAKVAKGDMSWP